MEVLGVLEGSLGLFLWLSLSQLLKGQTWVGKLLDLLGLGVENANKFPKRYSGPQKVCASHGCSSSVWKRPALLSSQPIHPYWTGMVSSREMSVPSAIDHEVGRHYEGGESKGRFNSAFWSGLALVRPWLTSGSFLCKGS